MSKELKEYNGFWFHKDTPEKVCKLICEAYKYNFRIRVFYGDTQTGRDWMEFNDVIGTIGRSTGERKIPLLIRTKRSLGGGAILTQCIVKIMQNGAITYRNPQYYLPKLEIDGEKVFADGVHIATGKDSDKANKIVGFLRGAINKI